MFHFQAYYLKKENVVYNINVNLIFCCIYIYIDLVSPIV